MGGLFLFYFQHFIKAWLALIQAIYEVGDLVQNK
jgi:hypothetical protein